MSSISLPSIHGRGTASNPPSRFALEVYAPDPDETRGGSRKAERTQWMEDASQSILTRNDSPDIPFRFHLNPYRGCEHGCVYCYARPSHEFLGYSAGLDFETRILVKREAPRLLAETLSRASWEPQPIGMSGVTDPYQPLERELGLTRGCLEVLAGFRNPVGLITKNAEILRDLNVLREMAEWGGVSVCLSITTLDAELARTMEPRTASPRQRLATVRTLAEAGIPVSVLQAPVIPGLTDTEMPALFEAAAEAGARQFGYLLLRLPGAVEGIFTNWLDRCLPSKKARILDRLRAMRGGQLNDKRFGRRMTGEGIWRENMQRLCALGMRRSGLRTEPVTLNVDAFRRPGGQQMELF